MSANYQNNRYEWNFRFQKDASKNKFLIDGFPRNKDNLDGWLEKMDAKVDLQFVLFFDCSEDKCIERCLSRNSGRVDDNIETLKNRFKVFYNDSMPIVGYYDVQDLVKKVDGTLPPEEVFAIVQKLFTQ